MVTASFGSSRFLIEYGLGLFVRIKGLGVLICVEK
jgi:hypothetical protein